MQGVANHQHDRHLHAGWRQHEDHDHDFLENSRGVYGSEKVAPQVHTTKSQLEGERVLPFAVCRIECGVIDITRIISAVRNKRHGDRTS